MPPEKDSFKVTKGDMRGINKDVANAAIKAMEYGWTAVPRGGGFALTCRCGQHHAYIPGGSKTGHIVKNLLANIERCPRNLGSPASEAAVRGLAKRSEEAHLTAPVAEVVTKDGKPVLVSERPHMSKKGERRGMTTAYESPVTIEQVWSDGHISFRCKFCEWGGYDQTNARSVANHSGNVHKNPENRLAQQDTVDIEEIRPPLYQKAPSTRMYNPAERLVMALVDAMDGHDGSLEDLAIAALKWMHERPDLGPVEDRVRNSEPKTPEEQIALIRTLVDGGRYDRLETEIARLTAALAGSDAALVIARDNEARMRTRLERVTEELMEGL